MFTSGGRFFPAALSLFNAVISDDILDEISSRTSSTFLTGLFLAAMALPLALIISHYLHILSNIINENNMYFVKDGIPYYNHTLDLWRSELDRIAVEIYLYFIIAITVLSLIFAEGYGRLVYSFDFFTIVFTFIVSAPGIETTVPKLAVTFVFVLVAVWFARYQFWAIKKITYSIGILLFASLFLFSLAHISFIFSLGYIQTNILSGALLFMTIILFIEHYYALKSEGGYI